jgi:hypothetical protein
MTNKNTKAFGPPSPCIKCEKGLKYMEFGKEKAKFEDCIESANNFTIVGGYGSAFDGFLYKAILCDDCMDKLIQKGQVEVIGKD